MGKAISYEVRAKIIRDRQSGQTQRQIAESLACSLSVVKRLLRRHGKLGEAALPNSYSNCGKSGRRHFSDEMEAEVRRRKDELPGSGYVHAVLHERDPSDRVPSVRTIQRRWQALGNPRKKGRPPQSANTWTKEVHHTWQIDGKELVELADGSRVSWVNIADEASSTALRTEVFPPQNDERGAAAAHVRGG